MESTPSELAEGAAVIKVLAAVLERLVAANGKIAQMDPGVITRFHALKPPSISVLSYLQRIHKYASCSTECFILALIYIDRLIQRNNFLLTELNVHRVVITSIMLAAKFFDDQYFNNAYYAKVGGVPPTEMNSLEVEFLFRINFSLHVTPELYNKYHSELVTHAVAADGRMPSSPDHVSVVPPSPPMPPQQAPHHMMGVDATCWNNSNGIASGVGYVQQQQQQQQQYEQQSQMMHQPQQGGYPYYQDKANAFPHSSNPFANNMNPNIPCQASFQQNGRVSGAVA